MATVETQLWKYGGAIENGDNYKQVYNTKSDSNNNAVDHRLLSDSWEMRALEVCDFLRDFGAAVEETTGVKTITVTMTARWSSNQTTLQDLCVRYVTDGMMADYLNVAAPNEAVIYANRLQADEQRVKNNLYSVNPPTLP